MKSITVCLLALSTLTIGCGGTSQRLQQPEFEFEGAALDDVSLKGAKLDVLLKLKNPNSVGLTLDRVHYAVTINQTQLATGTLEKPVNLPANGENNVSFLYKDAFTSVQQMLNAKKADLSIQGDAFTHGKSIPYKAGGTFYLPDRAALQRAALKAVSKSG
jgi:LEA14-like dessication related protein